MHIRFRLSKRSFRHESTKDSNERRLTFHDAWKVNGRLRVGDKGEVHCGAVHIREGIPSKSEFATLSYVPSEKTFNGKTYPHLFQADIHILPETFNYLLNLDEEQTIVELSLGFDAITGNFKWDSSDEDDEDIYWDIASKSHTDCFFEIADSVEISTFPRERTDIEGRLSQNQRSR